MATESREALRDVGGIADLAELTVTHDRYAGLLLPGHGTVDGSLNQPVEFSVIVGLAMITREQQRGQLAPARQTSHVGGRYAEHRFPPSTGALECRAHK